MHEASVSNADFSDLFAVASAPMPFNTLARARYAIARTGFDLSHFEHLSKDKLIGYLHDGLENYLYRHLDMVELYSPFPGDANVHFCEFLMHTGFSRTVAAAFTAGLDIGRTKTISHPIDLGFYLLDRLLKSSERAAGKEFPHNLLSDIDHLGFDRAKFSYITQEYGLFYAHDGAENFFSRYMEGCANSAPLDSLDHCLVHLGYQSIVARAFSKGARIGQEAAVEPGDLARELLEACLPNDIGTQGNIARSA